MRLDVYLHLVGQPDRLERIEALLQTILSKETAQMALGQELLDRITAESGVIASIKTLIQGLVGGTITAEAAAAIIAQLDANDAALAAAIVAGTP